jgi:hypothetical protein
MKKLMNLCLCLLICPIISSADSGVSRDFGIKANVLWPFYPGGKYRLTARKALNSSKDYRTEGHLGLSFQVPVDRDTEGRWSEQAVLIGFRQYLASPLHFELVTGIGKSKLENHVKTGLDYEATAVEVHVSFGYEWMLSANWSVDVQAGAAKVLSKSEDWPVYKDSSLTEEVGEEVIPTGAIHITYWF